MNIILTVKYFEVILFGSISLSHGYQSTVFIIQEHLFIFSHKLRFKLKAYKFQYNYINANIDRNFKQIYIILVTCR